MSEPLPTVESVRKELGDLVAPFRAKLQQVNDALDAKQAEAANLRTLQREIANALKAVDPEYAEARAKTKLKRVNGVAQAKKARARGTEGGFSIEYLNKLYEWLVTVAPEYPDGLVASRLSKREDAPFSQSQLSKALIVLQEQSRVRLDSYRGQGGAKVYRLTAS